MSADTPSKPSLTAWERWELASFDPETPPVSPPVAVEPPPPLVNQEEIDRIKDEARREGHQAGYAAGHAEGLVAGQTQAEEMGRQEAARIVHIVVELEKAISELNLIVADNLLALALEVARQVTRQAIAVKPEVILAVIREALAQLPMHHAAIHLHPEDASLARSHAGDQLSHAGHRIHEDPKLARGDVIIEAGGSHLDATLSTRWQRVLETLAVDDAPWIDEPDQ